MKNLTIILLFISIKTFGQIEHENIHLYFSFDKFELEKEAIIKMDDLMLNRSKIEKIELFGHTDNKGSTEYNLTLSKKRVLSIQEYLIQQGINSDQIKVDFFGEASPFKTNDTDVGRKK